MPRYLAARDRLDPDAVASLGGNVAGVATLSYGAVSAYSEASGSHAAGANAQALKSLQPRVTAILASGLPPQVFHGHLVVPSAVAIEFSSAPGASHLPKLLGEIERTIGMLALVRELQASFGPGSKKREDTNALAAARLKVVGWQGRALDLASLKATLGPIWELLDSTATPMDPKPSLGLDVASRNAKRVGWMGDTGTFDLAGATGKLQSGDRGDARKVLQSLYTSDPDTRAKFLGELERNKVLETFCDNLSWQEVKQLHDSLGYGFAEIKTDLQAFFLGKDKYGPSLGEEWENHDRSLHSLLGPDSRDRRSGTYCNVNAMGNESINDIRRFLNGDPAREKMFKIELEDAISRNMLSSAKYEKLTDQDFDTQEEYIEALKEFRNEVFPGG